MTIFSATISHYQPLLGWESKIGNCHRSDLHVANKALKVHFLANYGTFVADNVSFLKPC